MPETMRSALYFLLHCVWGFPQTLLGILVFAYVRVLDREALTVRGPFSTIVTHTKRIRGGISLGMFIVTADYRRIFGEVPSGAQQRLDAHELGHAKQSFLLGPLYLPLVGLPSIARAGLLRISRRFGGALAARWGHSHWYYSGYPERWADRLAGIERTATEAADRSGRSGPQS